MKLLKILVEKEAISISIALLIIVFGLFSITKIPVRLFPKVTLPIISIQTIYPGASAEVVKSFVTSQLENAIAGLPNIHYITAGSSTGLSQIQVYLTPDTPVESSMIHIMEKINEQKSSLPPEVKDPMVAQASNEYPAMIIAFTSRKMPKVQVAEYLRRIIKPELEIIDGVASAEIMGPEYAIKIHLNPRLLNAYSFTATDVLTALKQQNVLSQTGSLEGKKTNFNLDTRSYFDTPQLFNNLLIKENNEHAVRLSDIGHANFTEENTKINAFYNNQPALIVFIKLVSGANPLTVSTQVENALSKIQTHLPYDLKADVTLNIADYIKNSIHEVWFALGIACVIISFVLILFLRSCSAMSIPLITIPISLVGSLFLINLAGFSLNTLTLLALVLAVGLVVDDAIVVVENVFRYLPHAKTSVQATYKGTKEIMGPVISMTLTLSAVFAPVFFMSGILGKLFSEFAFALAGSVFISGFISLTLTPMMCSKLLSTGRKKDSPLQKNMMNKHVEYNRKSQWLENLTQHYQNLLALVFKQRNKILGMWLLSIISCFILYQISPKELAPQEDPGYLMVIGNGPTQANQHYILKYRPAIHTILSSLPGTGNIILLQGIPSLNGFMSFVNLSTPKNRLTAMALQPILQNHFKNISGINSYVIIPNDLPGDSGSGFQLVIKSNADYKKLYEVAKSLEQTAMCSGLFAYLNDDLNYNQPHFQLNIHRDALEAHHVSMSSVNDSLSLLTGEFESQQFSYFSQSYHVILSADKRFRHNPDQLNNIMVKNNQGALIPLSDLMSTHIDIQPSSLNEFQKQNAVTITGVLAPNISFSQAIHYIQQTIIPLLPENIQYDYAGQTRQFQEEGSRFLEVFTLSLMVIFLILSIQFNSFRDALLILLGSVPLSLSIALVPLAFHLASINIYTQIALLTLVGLITKHGVLMTEFANQLKETGTDKATAIRQAAATRFRPILMTTVAMALGALPLVMATGAGSVSRFQMGLIIFVGLSIGTLCTLFIFPVLYQTFSKESNVSLPISSRNSLYQKKSINQNHEG